MNPSFYSLIVSLLFLTACQLPKAKHRNDALIGVWSGLLFQTESSYDSISLQPVARPGTAILYKNGKAQRYELQSEHNSFSLRAKGGLRFDATYLPDAPKLHGVITHQLWSQSLSFSKQDAQWIAKIQKPEIIDTDYRVYLEFYEDELGILQAKIQSNKENRSLHFEIDAVKLTGNHIDFAITNDRFSIAAAFQPDQNNLMLTYGNAGGTREIPLNRLKPSELQGYQPLSASAYRYQVPQPVDGFLPSASLEDVGLNLSLLDFMPEMNSGKYDHIHSIIITKDQKLVFEEYFHGYHREYLHDIRSSFKSIASLLLGKAMMQDADIDVNSPIVDYYPEYSFSDKRKEQITLHHVLTMSSGLALEDEDEMQWRNQDWVGYKLKLPLEHEPGKIYQYSSGGMNLLTGVLERATEQYLPLFLYESMLLPMGIETFQMRTSPKGRGYLAGDFYLRPIDFTKFGLLVLNQGKWNEQQIINTDWLTRATQAHIKSTWPKQSDYGYLWKLLEREVGGKKMKTIEAWGNGGQFLIIIPEIDMTLTFTGGNYNLFPEMEDKPFELLEKYILPAVEVGNE